MVRKVIITLLVGFLILLIGALLGGIYLVDYALKESADGRDIAKWQHYIRQNPNLALWLDSLESKGALKDTSLIAPDGAKLHAIFASAVKPTRKTALIVHGYSGNAVRFLNLGNMYQQALGYNILLPDLRAHGKSEGRYVQMGWNDRKDILQWIDCSKAIFGDSIQLVLHGVSMGAATVMQTDGEQVPDFVKCYVADCGYTSVWDEFEGEIKTQFHLPAFPLLYAASWYCDLTLGWNFKEASPLKQIAKCTRPLFLIHGGSDTFVPTSMAYQLFEAKPGPKELWVLPGVEHANAYWENPKQYTLRVGAFIGKYR